MDMIERDAARAPVRRDFIPADRYTGPDVAARERRHLWPRIWHIACREEEIPNPGDYITYEILDDSIIVVRTPECGIRAHYNVCQHRGRRLLPPGRGHVRGFVCGFHGWKYALDGACTYVHREQEWADTAGFSRQAVSLAGVRAETWGGWVWINMDEAAPALTDWLGDVVPIMENFDLPAMRRAWHEVLIAPVNWKVVVEAFAEGYHSGATHGHWVDYNCSSAPATVRGNHAMFNVQFHEMPKVRLDDGTWERARSTRDLIYYQCKELHRTLHALVTDPLMRAAEALRNEVADDATDEQTYAKFWELQKREVIATGAVWPEKLTPLDLFRAGINWHIFPNTIFLPAIDGILWYRMRPHPDSAGKCIFDIWCLRRFPPGSDPTVETHVSDGFAAARGRNAFLEQDFGNMRSVEAGMNSRGWRGARVNPSEEAAIAHFHAMLDKYCFADVVG